MTRGDSRTGSSTQSKPNQLWFGTSLGQFLTAELKDTPARRVAALRLFVVTLTIALVSQTLHIPPLGAISILICLSYDAYANAGQSLAFGIRQLGYLIVTTLVSVLTLMLAGNDPWLLLPLSFVILALSLFHARLIAWPTGIALWYSVAVLYSPNTPDENIYHALWNIPIIGVLALGTWTVVHLTIKPQDPLKLLKAEIATQLAAVEYIFSARLADAGAYSPRPDASMHAAAGSLGKLLGLLANAELIHPGLHERHPTYRALLLEIDGLRQLADWLNQVLAAEYRAQPLTPEKLNVYQALQTACAKLRQGLAESRDVSADVTGLLNEEVLQAYARESNPSLLTALWRALQRIAGLMQALHQTVDVDSKDIDQEAGDKPENSWLPACLGYEFWASHADSVQFGIKFSLGAILCTLIVESLDWPDINTAIPTCLVAAQTSLGADYRLSLLRVTGAAVGGICAYFYVLVFQSQLDTMVGFAFATAPFWALAAWITAGSERIAYLGRQLGFSFALFVLHDFGQVTDLYLPRDRVIGILLGLIVMGVIDYALWPRRSTVLARHHSIAALRTLANFTSRLPDVSLLFTYTLPLRLAAEKQLAAAQDLLAHAVLEPDARLVERVHERAALRTIVRDAGHLSGLLQVRKRYRLLSGQRFSHFPDELQQLSRAFDAALTTALEYAASLLQGEPVGKPVELADHQARLKQSYTDHHGIDNLADDLAVEWLLRFMLDEQIVALIAHIETAALAATSYPQKSAPGLDLQ
ncbi:FUSC family protein [Methylomonas sp. TEB]|uniref:FUSC family protein n=1 Tax=Methylomonas sp. TEB TaxID=3398229 RepID=UPI0039F456A2